MQWDQYKALADTPGIWTRWMLEQMLALLAAQPATDLVAEQISQRMRLQLSAPPVEKPPGFSGSSVTDLFPLELSSRQVQLMLRIIVQAQQSSPVPQLPGNNRGLGGFTEAWTEYLLMLQGRTQTNNTRIQTMADAEAIVLRLIDGFNQMDLDQVVSCFTDDAVYHNIPMEVVTGREAIRESLAPFLAGATAVQWDLLSIASNPSGHVLTERVDKFEIGGKWLQIRVMGICEVADGKITAWRDYFDLAEFQSQMAG